MKIVILGAGNVAQHLAPKLHEANHQICQVFSRKISKAKRLAKQLGAQPINELKSIDKQVDLILIMISDKAIELVSNQIKSFEGLIAHTSGSVSSKVLSSHSNYGVFYPLQSFKNMTENDWQDLPILYTANRTSNKKILKELAKSIELRSMIKSDKERKAIHLSAVVLNNFINHLFVLNQEWLVKNRSDLNLLTPLIKKTVNNLLEGDPLQLQTGPAKRDDRLVIDDHINMLKDFPQLKTVYELFSNSIIKTYS